MTCRTELVMLDTAVLSPRTGGMASTSRAVGQHSDELEQAPIRSRPFGWCAPQARTPDPDRQIHDKDSFRVNEPVGQIKTRSAPTHPHCGPGSNPAERRSRRNN